MAKYSIEQVMNAMSSLNEERRRYLQSKKDAGLNAMEQQQTRDMEHALETGELTPDLEKILQESGANNLQ